MGGREEEFCMDMQAESPEMFNDQIHDLATMGLPLGSSFDEDVIVDNTVHVSFPPKSDTQYTMTCHTETVSFEGEESNEVSAIPESPPISSPTQSPKVHNREISVNELDRMQRKRREDREKRHAQLQYQALTERIKKREQSGTKLSRLNGFAPQASSDSNEFLVPRMNTRSFRRPLDGAPVLILPRKQSAGRLDDFFQSPDSNKFVLQFPDNPSKELNIDEIDFEDNSLINSQQTDTMDVCCNESKNYLKKISSIGLFTVQDDDASSNDVQSSESANSSPTRKRNIIMLKPKKRYQKESPCSTSSSSVEYDCNFNQPRADDVLFYPNENSYDEPRGASKATYLSFRPKKRFITSSTPGPFSDESEDIVMELNPDLNLSRSFSRDTADKEELGSGNTATTNVRPQSSVSFRDRFRACRENFSFKGRSLSFQSTASQGTKNDEHADRLAMPPPSGLTRAPSYCTTTSEDLLQSPSLSESNFRTPNPESARRRYWFGAPTPGCHSPMNDGLDRSSSVSSAVGLFLPKLFGANPEDEEDFSISHQRSSSTSFFGRVRDAFSPPQVSLSK
jgi:hypothetical protein